MATMLPSTFDTVIACDKPVLSVAPNSTSTRSDTQFPEGFFLESNRILNGVGQKKFSLISQCLHQLPARAGDKWATLEAAAQRVVQSHIKYLLGIIT